MAKRIFSSRQTALTTITLYPFFDNWFYCVQDNRRKRGKKDEKNGHLYDIISDPPRQCSYIVRSSSTLSMMLALALALVGPFGPSAELRTVSNTEG